jgi:hypothetical protein
VLEGGLKKYSNFFLKKFGDKKKRFYLCTPKMIEARGRESGDLKINNFFCLKVWKLGKRHLTL